MERRVRMDKKITNAEREMVKAILEDPDVGTFFELDALPKLYEKFGIPANTVHSVAETAATNVTRQSFGCKSTRPQTLFS